MKRINPVIFRSYDIRGIIEKELNYEDAVLIGKSFGSYIQETGENKVIIGHDNRESSEKLNKKLIEGLISTGVHVIDIGLVTTPILYYSRKLFNIGPAIEITASHNPREYNGFKICINKEEESIFGEKIKDLLKYTQKGEFKEGKGSIEKVNILEDYINEISERIKLGDRKLQVAVDCGNGTASIIAEKLLKKLGVNVIPLYCDSDPRFPNHHPDPSVAENLKDLSDLVVKTKSDLGIGFDGDGDRIGIVDEQGNVILGDMYMLIIWRDIAEKYKGSKALVEVKCSQSLWDELEKLGMNPEFIRTGNPYIKAAMKEKDIPFSGEMSGHIFFRDEYYGFDDATYAAARILRLLSNTRKKASDLLSGINTYITTPEITKKVKEEDKFKIVENAVKYFKDKNYKVIDVDGARVVFENGWGLIRASNTSPIITIRYEAKNKEELIKIESKFEKMLDEIIK